MNGQIISRNSLDPESRSQRGYALAFCVVVWHSERTKPARGAMTRKVRKKFAKYDFCVAGGGSNATSAPPAGENAYFCSEYPNPMKNPQSEDETPANRPSRIRWCIKFRYFIVSDGEKINFRDFRVLESHIFGRSGQTRSKICNLKLGQPPIDPPGSIGPLQVEICTYRTGHGLEKWSLAPRAPRAP